MEIFGLRAVGRVESKASAEAPVKEVTFHAHSNTDVLDKLSESASGRLLFNGNPLRSFEHIAAYLDGTITEGCSAATIAMEDFVLPSNCTGSRAFAKLLPANTVNIPIKINDVSVAQLSINSAGVCQFIGPSTITPIPEGSRIEFVLDALANTGCGDLSLVLRLGIV